MTTKTMHTPFIKLQEWINNERQSDNQFASGAVLSTVSTAGIPRSRVVGTMLNEYSFDAINCRSTTPGSVCRSISNPDHTSLSLLRFHTSPASRKVHDVTQFDRVSLTYSLSQSLRSVSIEGQLAPLSNAQLAVDWMKYDADFRRHYHIFGHRSGTPINSIQPLNKERDSLTLGAENISPSSFIGFFFKSIDRMAFYAVKSNDFAQNDVYEWEPSHNRWGHQLLVP